jgi:hypothetical protein
MLRNLEFAAHTPVFQAWSAANTWGGARASISPRSATSHQERCAATEQFAMATNLNTTFTALKSLGPHAKLLTTVSAVLIFGSWLLTNTWQSAATAQESRLRTIAQARGEYARHQELVHYVRQIARDFVAQRGVPTDLQEIEKAVATIEDRTPRPTEEVLAAKTLLLNRAIRLDKSPEAAILTSRVDDLLRFSRLVEDYFDEDSLNSIAYRLHLLRVANPRLYEELRQPTKAIAIIKKRLEDLEQESRMDLPGERAEEWLARYKKREAQIATEDARIEHMGFALVDVAGYMEDFTAAEASFFRSLARDGSVAATVVFVLGSLLAIGARIAELAKDSEASAIRKRPRAPSLPLDPRHRHTRYPRKQLLRLLRQQDRSSDR